MSEKRIKEMLKKVADRKTEIAEIRGEKTAILKQMEEEGCETLEDIEEDIEKETRNLGKIDREIEKGMKELEEDFDWS